MKKEVRQCQNCKQPFLIEPDDFAFYEHILVPPPTFCPECRAARRLSFWNERHLFRKNDVATGKEIFSTYPKASPIKIFDHDYWWSDAWDGMNYGRGYDFNRSFFDQFKELLYNVPLPSREIKQLVRSDYCNNAGFDKDCYLVFDVDNSERCAYCVGMRYSRDSFDSIWTSHLQSCYEVFSGDRNYESFFVNECCNCRNVWFSRDCLDCSHCFGCANLRHKEYYIFNKPYPKEEYERTLREMNIGSYASLVSVREKARAFWRSCPVRYMHGTHNSNVVGEYLTGSKNSKYCYQGDNLDNVRYSQKLVDAKDCYDFTSWSDKSELVYESVIVGYECRNVKFSFSCWNACRDIEYCISCRSSSNCFGCVSLKDKEYCILNKQYTKGEYESLIPKIKEQMNARYYIAPNGNEYRYGEFFPFDLSPLSYNESAAYDYIPIRREDFEKRGLSWRDLELRKFEVTLPSEKIPDSIQGVDETVLKEAIGCASCGNAFRLIQMEYEFYKKYSLPIPRLCHLCRYNERIKNRNPLRWYKRTCQCVGVKSENGIYTNAVPHPHGAGKCSNEFETPYAPEREEIVYCEQCYQSEVV